MSSKRVQILRKMVTEPNPRVSIERDMLFFESMKKTEGEPMVLRHAKAMAHVLSHIDVEIFSGELIVGKVVTQPPGGIIYAEAYDAILYELDALEHREPRPFEITKEEIESLTGEIRDYWALNNNRAYFQKYLSPELGNIMKTGAILNAGDLVGAGHIIINYPLLISQGFKKIGEAAESKIMELQSSTENDSQERITFYEAEKILCKSIIDFADRYSQEAERLADGETNPTRKDELIEIAKICRNVPANPPSNFHEGLQFVRLTHLVLTLEMRTGASVSMGRIDQYLFPLFRNDILNRTLTHEKAIELIECLWIKINEIVPLVEAVVVPFIRGLLSTQSVTIGGFDEEGKDVSNELTNLILQATTDVAVPVPNVHVRVNKNSSPEMLDELANAISSGTNVVAIFNDDVIVESWVRKGVPLEEARDYAVIGCVELAPNGTSSTSAGAGVMNLAMFLEMALSQGRSLVYDAAFGPDTGDPLEFKSIDDVIDAYTTQLSYFVNLMGETVRLTDKTNMEMKPTPFLSLCVEDCFEIGRDITTGSARYNYSGIQGIGLVDVADSLAAIDELVFKQKLISMKELVEAIRADFENAEPLRQMLLNKAPKYGNDNELVDSYAQLVAQMFSEELEKQKNHRGGELIAGLLSVSVHEPYGWFTGALPSGRNATTILNNGVSPVIGATTKGLTPILQSGSKIDYTLYSNGVAFTVNLDPGIIEGEDGHNVFNSIIRSYFDMGGMQIQFNLIDVETLLKARENPKAHRDLMVRVAGYSAYFVDLSNGMQDEVIGRFQRG